MPAATPTAPAPAAAPRAPRPRLLTITAAVAAVGVVAALVGIGLSARPLRTPTQDCGTAFTFLAGGRVNEFADPGDLPPGTTEAEAEANNAEPCQERAADRALPAGIAVVGGTALGLAALFLEAAARFRLHRRQRRRWLAASGPS